MLIGVDSFDTHLDMINWDGFRRWNGDEAGLDRKPSGGDPAFAASNFVGAKSIWAHAEAMDAIERRGIFGHAVRY